MDKELISKIIVYNYNELGNEFGDALVDLKNENEHLQQRIDKAVEWCEFVINCPTTAGDLPNGTYTDMGYCLDLAKPLLNILKGDDTNES